MDQLTKIIVKGIEVNRGGQIILFLYSKDGFPKDHSKSITRHVSEVSDEVVFELQEVPEEYALKVLHDEDLNGEVTKNWSGIIPKEGLGFSNGKKIGLLGPPKYEACTVKREQNLHTIQIQYL